MDAFGKPGIFGGSARRLVLGCILVLCLVLGFCAWAESLVRVYQ